MAGEKLKRLGGMWRTSSGLEVVGFLLGRLLARRLSSVVYDDTPSTPRVPSPWGAEEEFHIFGPANYGSIPGELRELMGGAKAEEYLRHLPDGDRLFAIRVRGTWSSYGFVMCRSRQVRVLGERAPLVLIGNCFSAPAARGLGLYRRGLNDALRQLWAEGTTRVLIETHPQNWPSRKGIQGAGFHQIKLIEGIIFFNRIVVASVDAAGGRHLRLWTV